MFCFLKVALKHQKPAFYTVVIAKLSKIYLNIEALEKACLDLKNLNADKIFN